MGIFFLYAVFFALITLPVKATLAESISGEWMLTTVSLQSLAILTALTLSPFPAWQAELVLGSLSLFLVGVILYIVIITLIFYHLVFFVLEPAAFEPSYWITAGADAITSLAGATLMANSHWSWLLELLRPFLLGLTVPWVTGHPHPKPSPLPPRDPGSAMLGQDLWADLNPTLT